jgi:hypothetical protein
MNARSNFYAVYISWRLGSSGFFTAFDAILRAAGLCARWQDCVVAFAVDHVDLPDRLDEKLQLACRPTPEFFTKLAAAACVRLAALRGTAPAARLERLIATGAWTDAAIALVELEIPAWKIRRLVHEDGEWLCSLSRQPNLPVALDDLVEARHEKLPLAILAALVEARRIRGAAPAASPTVPHVAVRPEQIICCDNFA